MAPETADQARSDASASTLPPLPTLPEPSSAVAGLAMIALPVASGAGAVVVALGRPGSAMAVGSLVVLVASIAVGALLFVGQRHGTAARIRRQRRRYLDAVDAVDRRLCDQADQWRGTARVAARSPAGYPATVRLGIVTVAAPVPPPPPAADGLLEPDPVCAAAVADLQARRSVAHGVPLDLPLGALRRLIVEGPPAAADGLLRRLVLDVAAVLPPRHLAIVVTGARDQTWVRWLPHCTRGIVLGRPGQSLRADLVDPIDDPLPDLAAAPDPKAILHVDLGPPGSHGPSFGRSRDGITAGTDQRIARWRRLPSGASHGIDGQAGLLTHIEVDSHHSVTVHLEGGPTVSGRTTVLCPDRARMVARSIAHRWSTDLALSNAPDTVITRRHTSPQPDASSPDQLDASPQLRVVVGRRPDGTAVALDLKDAAQGGMGPHGLVVGATGSGKSEFLRGLTLRLTETHDPDQLVLLLVDYKGGSTFAPFARLPHVAGLLTNLAGDHHLTERFAAALRGESVRRQALLAAAGVSDIAAFRRLPDPPDLLPTMLVVVDEYTELLTAQPDLAELFTGLGRVGRSLGLHLLLATQRLDPGRSRGVDTHLSYKVVLRTFTAAESQELLGSTAAFTLPRTPGEALLVAAGEEPIRFRVDRCPSPATVTTVTTDPSIGPAGPRPFPETSEMHGRLTRLAHLLTKSDESEVRPVVVGDPLAAAVQAVKDRLTGHPRGAPARPVWLPPLAERIALSSVPTIPQADDKPWPALSLGLVDRPDTQEQTTLTWTPVGQSNLVITGAGRSGRSNALMAVIAAAAATTPGQVEVYGVALVGTAAVAARGWPHVIGVAGPDDRDFAERLLGLVATELDRRERAAGRPDPSPNRPTPHPLMLLVVDDWAPGGALDDEIDRLIADIAARGPAVGIATAVATAAGTVLRGRVAASFGTRVELRPADAFESAIDRRLAASLPSGVPGRALVVDGIAQIAVAPDPGSSDPFVVDAQRRWSGRGGPRRHPLPERVLLDEIWPPPPDATVTAPGRNGQVGSGLDHDAPTPGAPLAVVLGVDERDGPAVVHLLGRPDAHLVVLGDPGSGRTTVLRSVARQIGPTSAALLVAIDFRGDLTSGDLGIPWAATARRIDEVGALVTAVLRHLSAPLPPATEPGPDGSFRTSAVPDHSPAAAGQPPQRRTPVVVLIDDEELLSGGMGHPLAPLLSAARSGSDLGLHLIVARGSGGFARARFEPLHQTLTDLGTPTLLLSSSPEEGRLSHRLMPRPLPPGRAQWAVRGRPRRLLQTPLTGPPAATRNATRPDAGPEAPPAGPAMQ